MPRGRSRDQGRELSVPSTYWGYWGNGCGDADGDGRNEVVKSSIFDVNGQLALYGKWQILGHDRWDWIDWPFPVSGWGLVLVNDFSNRGKGPFVALRRNLLFKEFQSLTSSALTPMIGGSATIPATGSGFSAKLRDCVPLHDRINYVFAWGDGTNSAFSGNAQEWTRFSHNYAQTGAKTLMLSAITDALGRNLGPARTSLSMSRQVLRPPSPCRRALSVTSPSLGVPRVAPWKHTNCTTNARSVGSQSTLNRYWEVYTSGYPRFVWIKACRGARCGPFSTSGFLQYRER
jgi:hypothetical protein